MLLRDFLICIGLFIFFQKPLVATSQTLQYPKEAQFECYNLKILGRLKNHVLVYTSYLLSNNEHKTLIYVFDTEMHLLHKTEVNLPWYFDFLVSRDVIYLFYLTVEDQKVYLMCSTLNDNGEMVRQGERVQMLSNEPSWKHGYQKCIVLGNENVSKIMVVRQPLKYDKSITLSTWLFDNQLHLEHKSVFTIPMLNWNEELSEFNVDYEGNLVFLRISKEAARNNLIVKAKDEDTVSFTRFVPSGVFIRDNVKLKINNANQSYLVFADCFRKKHGTESGIYFFAWDKNKRQPTFSTKTFFPETKRGDDLFVNGIKIKSKNGYLVEALSTDPQNKKMLKNIKVIDFDSTGNVNWTHYIKESEVKDSKDANILYNNTFVNDTCIYYIYDQRLKNDKSYVAVQGIGADGALREPTIIHSKMEAYPAIGNGLQINENELLLPFESGYYKYFGILKF